ncbi:MAG: isopentenyl-diphosphate Delta-isomerase [Candidatus Pacebacteria bacterium]|nr:isopentenyl-diphosphate Delta-isomerase [Candidatus Paceibacterota bacterium]
MFKKQVMLVDENDNQTGKIEKLKAHQLGLLHRAFSIFIFNNRGDLLLQKRAKNKYHSPGLWSNACCSHPISNSIQKEAKKRLKKEMAINCPIKEIFSFIYTAKVGDLTENEFDHVFIGFYNGKVSPNKKEASDYKWINFKDLKNDISQNPQNYTEWLKLIYEKVKNSVH